MVNVLVSTTSLSTNLPTPSCRTPYLSIVIASRNDGYLGDLIERLTIFQKCLLLQLEQYRLNAELIVVEWNPPRETASLADVIPWIKGGSCTSVRVIRVDERQHDRYPNARRTPMLEYPAKNVGIQRAKGRFVLSTNADLLYSEELIRFLAQRQLCDEAFYRVDRYDYSGLPLTTWSPAACIQHARANVFVVHIRQTSQWKRNWIRIRPWSKWLIRLTGSWPGSANQCRERWKSDTPVIPMHDDDGLYWGLHTNASGDFLLASADSWQRSHGFAEIYDTFTHLDSYACYQFKALGYKQFFLAPPCMAFHADHPRIEHSSRLQPAAEEWKGHLAAIRAGTLGPAINDDNWGLAGEELEEVHIV